MTNTALIGIAGVHYVVSELSRRGLVALPTVKNTAAYDIVAMNPEGTRHANIQVKASSKKAGFFPMPIPGKIRVGTADVYVLVRWLQEQRRYQGFLLSGHEAREAVERELAYQELARKRGTLKVLFPSVDISKRNAKYAEHWQDAWEAWTLL